MNTFSANLFSQTEEKQIRTIYYLAIDESKIQKEKNKDISLRHRKEPLAIYKCRRNYLFAEGAPSIAGKPVVAGKVQIYYSFLPEDFLKDVEKPRKKKYWIQKISHTMQAAERLPGGSGSLTVLFSKEICSIFGRKQELPCELYGILLFEAGKQADLRNITLSLPKEYGPLMAEEALSLIEPYLIRVQNVIFTGEETEAIWEMEDYLYNEYGIVMGYGKYPAEHSVWIVFGEEDISPLQSSREKEIYPINSERIWKFLDTLIKSGYNTKVN